MYRGKVPTIYNQKEHGMKFSKIALLLVLGLSIGICAEGKARRSKHVFEKNFKTYQTNYDTYKKNDDRSGLIGLKKTIAHFLTTPTGKSLTTDQLTKLTTLQSSITSAITGTTPTPAPEAASPKPKPKTYTVAQITNQLFQVSTLFAVFTDSDFRTGLQWFKDSYDDVKVKTEDILKVAITKGAVDKIDMGNNRVYVTSKSGPALIDIALFLVAKNDLKNAAYLVQQILEKQSNRFFDWSRHIKKAIRFDGDFSKYITEFCDNVIAKIPSTLLQQKAWIEYWNTKNNKWAWWDGTIEYYIKDFLQLAQASGQKAWTSKSSNNSAMGDAVDKLTPTFPFVTRTAVGVK